MYLLIWSSLLTLFSSMVGSLTKCLVNLTCSISDYEINLRKEIRDLQKELSQISMMDEFATYARTERKINKLKEKLENCSSARKVQTSKSSWAFSITLNSIVGLMSMLTVWSYWGQPVVTLPDQWVWPVGWLLSSPGVGVAGGVSLPVWMALCRTSMKMAPSLPSVIPTPNYSQLPLD